MPNPGESLLNHEPFAYEPLRTPSMIRLLHREKDTKDGMPNFSMKVFDLEPSRPEDFPNYHCLSYTWGNPFPNCLGFQQEFQAADAEYDISNQHGIICNGRLMKVGTNLRDFMEHAPRDYWVRRVRCHYKHLNDKTVLHTAARLGRLSILRHHLGHGADVSAKDRFGKTPLHYAVQYQQVPTTQCLLEAGADPTIKDNDNKMPIAYARETTSTELATALERRMRNHSGVVSSIVDGNGTCDCDKWIWIDSICINQEDLAERNSQVAIMDKIYDRAVFIIAWLGREDQGTRLAVDAITKITSAGEKFVNGSVVPYWSIAEEEYQANDIAYISKEEWDALAGLFSRQWFRRMWVVQEVALARDMVVYCGPHNIEYHSFTKTSALLNHWYRKNGFTPSNEYIPLDEVATSVEYYITLFAKFRNNRIEQEALEMEWKTQSRTELEKRSPFSLENLIWATFPFFSADPRDKMFALLSLLRLGPNRMIYLPQADYSLPVEECYLIFTLALMRETNNLAILSWVQDKSQKQVDNLPSWVPDFSLRNANNLVPEYFNAIPEELGQRRLFHSPARNDEPKRLGVHGYQFDVIKAVANPRDLRYGNKFKLDPSWFELCLLLDVKYHNGQNRTEALWRTLCRDQDSQGEHPAPEELGQSFKQLVCAMICEKAEKRFDHYVSLMAGLIRCSEIRKTGRLDASAVTNAIVEHQVSMREGASLEKEEFEHVKELLRVLEMLACNEVEPDDPSTSNCHTPSPIEVENYYRFPELFYPPTEHSEVTLDSQGNILIRTGRDYVTDAEEEARSTRTMVEEATKPFGRAFQAAYSGKRLFVTCNKYIGLGPMSMEEGDCIFLLPGARAPLVVRQLEGGRSITDDKDSRRQFSLVGEAYIHGIMHGEALKEGNALREECEQIYLV